MAGKIVVDTEAAYEIFVKYLYIGNTEIKRIFHCGDSYAVKMKRKARELMEKEGKDTLYPQLVNTKSAFQAWGIDPTALEKQYSKLRKYKEVAT
jgi:hypothetical protein